MPNRSQSNSPDGFWSAAQKATIITDILFSAPVMIATSSLIGVLGQHVPVISTFGLYGIIVGALFVLLLLYLIKALQVYAQKKARATRGTQEPPRWVRVAKWRLWKFGIALVIFGIGVVKVETRPPLPLGVPADRVKHQIASYRDMKKDVVRGKSVIVGALPRSRHDSTLIQNKLFEQCQILGPAAIMMAGNSRVSLPIFQVNSAEGDLLLEAKSPNVYGVLRFTNCHFLQCSFEGVSLVGDSNELKNIRASLLQ